MPDVSLNSIATASPASADTVLGVKGGVARQLHAGPSFGQLLAAEGSALAGHVAKGVGAVPRTVQARLRDTISVNDFGAVGDGMTDDTAAFDAAVAALIAGGTLHVPPGVYPISGPIILPSNSILRGAGFRATTIKQTRAFCAVRMSTGCVVEHIKIEGTDAANVGIDIDNCGLAYVHNVEVTGFTKAKAVAIRLHESYRIKLSYIYIYKNYIGIKFSGNVTTFEFSKGNIAMSTHRALEANNGANDSCELQFNGVYFESNFGANPIYFDHTGVVVFSACGFEANCGNGTDPKVIYVSNPTHLTLRSCNFGGFNSTVAAYTGTAYFVYLGNDVPRLVMDDCMLVQNYSLRGFAFRMVRSKNTGTVALTNNRLFGAAIGTDLEAQRIMLGGFDVASPPRSYVFVNNRALNAYVQRSSPVAITKAIVASSGTSSTLYSKQFPAGAFHAGAALKIRAWGRRSGATGTKFVQLGITAETLSVKPITAVVTRPDDWLAEVVILFRTHTTQSLTITGHDGTAVFTASTQLSKDTAAYDTTIGVLAVCSSVSDAITLDGLVIEWL